MHLGIMQFGAAYANFIYFFLHILYRIKFFIFHRFCFWLNMICCAACCFICPSNWLGRWVKCRSNLQRFTRCLLEDSRVIKVNFENAPLISCERNWASALKMSRCDSWTLETTSFYVSLLNRLIQLLIELKSFQELQSQSRSIAFV